MSKSIPFRNLSVVVLHVILGLGLFPLGQRSCAGAENALPNIVLIFIDDMGYADIGPFGSTSYPTPNLDKMAREGRKFTDFIVSSAVCSASRAALMTGCIHERVGIVGALGPSSKLGLASNEVTIAEICKQKNYATACYGKWHLGHQPNFLPTRQGFDEYLGLPYSNDMWPFHPEYLAAKKKDPNKKPTYPALPMIENETTIDSDVTAEDQTQLTRTYTEKAVRFVQKNRDRPFFVYLPHSMVHVPLYNSSEWDHRHANAFARACMEVDWSVGRIMETLSTLGIDDSTLVIFTSDNGPWLSYGKHAGSAGPLREGKGTSWEGGIRVPTLMRWPSKIAAGTTCDRLASTIDILPTVARLVGAELPKHTIDGKDIRSLMIGEPETESPHTTIPCYYANHQLQAIRSERWKLHFPHDYRSINGKNGTDDGIPVSYVTKRTELELYDLDQDVGERNNVAKEHPQVLTMLQQAADKWRKQLGDSLTETKGSEIRPAEQVSP